MKTCDTCKHWHIDPDAFVCVKSYYAPMDPDTFRPMEMPFEVRECMHPAKTFCERPVEPNGFGVADGSTFMAIFLTGEKFGCVRHEDA